MIKKLKIHIINQFKQIFKYFIIGFLCFLIDISILYVLLELKIINYILASAIGYLTGSTINYWLSINWVFKKRNLIKYWKVEFTFFIIIEVIALLLMSSSLYLLREFLHLNVFIAKIIATIIAAIFNYLSKYRFLFSYHPQLVKIIKEHIE